MDETLLNDILECSVCLNGLDATNKVLPCQHTFCKGCLLEIVKTAGELRCPECRVLVTRPVCELPTNILLLRLLEGIHNLPGWNRDNSLLCSLEEGGQDVTPAGSAALVDVSPTECSGTAAASAVTPSSSDGPTPPPLCPKQQKPVPPCKPCAKALYSFDAQEHSDLTFTKGDIIILHRLIDQNWFYGELNGKCGDFPATYVKVINPLPSSSSVPQQQPRNRPPPLCKALYDFDKNDNDCLQFKKGNVISLLMKIDNNWAHGRLVDKQGIFPIAYVEMNETAKLLMLKNPSSCCPGKRQKQQQQQQQQQPPTPRRRLSLTTSDPKQPPEISCPTLLSTSNPTANNIVNGSVTDEAAGNVEVYMAVYNYTPQKSDEIELKSGEVYCVRDKCRDGWFKGTSLRTGKSGVFPGNYVDPFTVGIDNGKHSPRNKAQRNSAPTDSLDTSNHNAGTGISSNHRSNAVVSANQSAVAGASAPCPPALLHLQGPVPRTNRAAKSISCAELKARRRSHSPSPKLRFSVSTPNQEGTSPWTSSPVSGGGSDDTPGNDPLRPTPSTEASSPRGSLASASDPTPSSSSADHSHRSGGIRLAPPSLKNHVTTPSAGRNENSSAGAKDVSSHRLPGASERTPSPFDCSTAGCAAGFSRFIVDAPVSVSVTVSAPPGPSPKSSSDKRPQKDRTKTSGFMKRFRKKSKSRESSPTRDGAAYHARSCSAPITVANSTALKKTPDVGRFHNNNNTVNSSSCRLQAHSGMSKLKECEIIPTASNSSILTQDDLRCRKRFRAIVPYPAQTSDELDLKVGDTIYVHKIRDDGWYLGTLQRTGKTGLFPGSFVETF